MSTQPPVPFYVGGRRYHACADLMQQPARQPSTLALDHYRQQQRRAALFRLAAVALLLALFLVALLVLRTLCGA